MGVLATMMSSPASIAQHLAVVLAGIILGAIVWAIIGSLWPGMGLPAFIAFLVAWGVERVNTIALERRHPELILSPGWVRMKLRYKPLELGENEYEISRTEFIRGQVALIIFGIPLGLFVAALVGIIWPAGKWLVFIAVFTCWVAIMLLGIPWSIMKE